MKIGVFSDVHGNAGALKNCLAFFHNHAHVQRLFFLGDIVGYFPNPEEALKILDEASPHCCLMGNHDAMLVGTLEIPPAREAVYQLNKIRRETERKCIEQVKSRSPKHFEVIGNTRILFVHGSPADPLNGYIYPDADLESFEELETDVVFMGHTHRPFIRTAGKVLIVNVGSVGLPRDNGSLSSVAVFDTDSRVCEIFRIPFKPQDILEASSDAIHSSVRECLGRDEANIIGTVWSATT